MHIRAVGSQIAPAARQVWCLHGNAPAATDKRRSLIKPFSPVDSSGDDVGLFHVHANRARDQ